MTYTIYGLTTVLSAFFLFASSIKMLGWQKMIFATQLKYMHSYGLNRQVLFVIGMIECFGTITIWYHGSLLGLAGLLALLLPSIGAVFFHLRFDTAKEGVPAMVTASLSALMLYLTFG